MNMKFSALTISAAALAVVYGGSALAQASAPVTMQPVPNPPETAKPAHMGKHHKQHAMHAKAKADAKAADTSTTPPTK
jgi:hypothetical protein